MGPLVVPMNPEFLPELALLTVGLFSAAAAVNHLSHRRGAKAAGALVASLACFAIALWSGVTLHKPAKPTPLTPAAKSSMSLVLGDVVLRVAPSSKYVLSVDGKSFLEIDSPGAGLRVSCVMGAENKPLAEVKENTFAARWGEMTPEKPDDHTILVQTQGADIFKVRYAEPLRIEVNGQFFHDRSGEPALISFQKGISWGGQAIPPGSIVDLSDQGSGRIDFGRSGQVRITPIS